MKVCCGNGKPVTEMDELDRLSCNHDHCIGPIEVEFNPEDMPIIEIDMSKVRQHKAMDELTEQAEILGMYEDREILTCKTPPEGWYCTIEDGHSGPCAAYPDGFDDTNIDLLFTCGTFDTNDCISVEQLTKLMKDGETK